MQRGRHILDPDTCYEDLLGDRDRSSFLCGVEPLDSYFHDQSKILHEVATFQTAAFVLLQRADQKIVGYYTLSNAAIVRTGLSSKVRRDLRYKETPATLIGRLARDQVFNRQDVGRILIRNALRRCFDLSRQSGSVVIIVDTIDDHAREFYARAQFRPLPKPENAKLVCPSCGSESEKPGGENESPYDTERMWLHMEAAGIALGVLKNK